MKIGTTTIPLAGWEVDPRRPEEGRARRLAAIRQLDGLISWRTTARRVLRKAWAG
ncbi:MAG TPA: hypothetical protein VMY40_13330 [Anaerolineae bacterium]|nr:hypothetical protein [Anaerolineae bacterium]